LPAMADQTAHEQVIEIAVIDGNIHSEAAERSGGGPGDPCTAGPDGGAAMVVGHHHDDSFARLRHRYARAAQW
jgi:hypothetical protein